VVETATALPDKQGGGKKKKKRKEDVLLSSPSLDFGCHRGTQKKGKKKDSKSISFREKGGQKKGCRV